MVLFNDVIGRLADRQGLVRVSLFTPGSGPKLGMHDVLLDGPYGSFAISAADDQIGRGDAGSWAWSSHVPHHATITNDKISIIRWDNPSEAKPYPLARALDDPDDFGRFLSSDRIRSPDTIVSRSMTLFRTIRVVVGQRGGNDGDAVDAYLSVLGWLSRHDDTIDLPGTGDGDGYWRNLLDERDLRAALADFRLADVRGTKYRAWASLSVRHASGSIFQEAHRSLGAVPQRDLFGYVPALPATGRGASDIHFTPPTLARSLSEQALLGLGDLSSRPSMTLADFTCGSGAFLVECLRALHRTGYRGMVRVVGRDASPLAARMAEYVLKAAASDWPPSQIPMIDVRVGDALIDELPKADVVVMNPPFAAWNDLRLVTRQQVRTFVEGASRPDYSMAFLSRALGSVEPSGAMAAIVPARVIEGDSNRGWRERVAGSARIPFVSVFDDLSLFEDATVRIGCFVCVAGAGAAETTFVHAAANATGESLRALRRARGSNAEFLEGEGWNLRRGATGDHWSSGSRLLPAPRLGKTSSVVTTSNTSGALSTIGGLFEVYQGIRTGGNGAMILTEDQLRSLPPREQPYFRRAVTSRGIEAGRVLDHVHVFHPYDATGAGIFVNEADLRIKVPAFYDLYLEPARQELQARTYVGEIWWSLSRPRPRFASENAYIVSKYFAEPGAFAIDANGDGTIVQGFAWFPKNSLKSIMERVGTPAPPVARAYLSLFNSSAFFDHISPSAPRVSGGQRDMSRRHIDAVAMPDLSQPELLGYVTPLASHADVAYGDGGDSLVTTPSVDVERLCRELLSPLSYARPSEVEDPAFELPPWMAEAYAAGMEDRPRQMRYRLLRCIQDCAQPAGLEVLDSLLHHVDVSGLHDLTIVTLLRGSFALRALLPHWLAFRNRVCAEFVARGHSIDHALGGLY